MDNPLISILIPFYSGMPNASELLGRCLYSVNNQTYKNIEIVIAEYGKTALNCNMGVKECNGEVVKILCMDDYFTNDKVVENIVNEYHIHNWLINGVSNHKEPFYSGDIYSGNNTLGGLSSISFRKDSFIPFNEDLVWLFDCDWHKQMYDKFGLPKIINGDLVTIEEGNGQATNSITYEVKRSEKIKMINKYV